MNHQKIVLAALLASLFGPAMAEEVQAVVTPPPAKTGDTSGAMVFHFDSAHGNAKTGTIVMRMNTIKNAPYRAEEVTERLQNLGDGNQIARRTTTMRYRDSAGRTREETRNENGETVVTINDPVAGQNLVLRPQSRTAMKITGPGQEARIAADIARAQSEAAREQVEQMRKDGSLPTVERRKLADGSEEIIVKRVERIDGQARARIQQDVRIQASQALAANSASAAANSAALRNLRIQLAPLTRGAFEDAQWSAKATVKDLGTREFDGVKAEGKLRSYEIPAGAIGNRNPIVVSDETWYAPDLQVTVFTKHSDPRSGDFVFKLDKLKREEPPAALFAVPADYTVTDPLAQARARVERSERKER
jgi:hypothetical protein